MCVHVLICVYIYIYIYICTYYICIYVYVSQDGCLRCRRAEARKVASHEDMVYGLWKPGTEQAEVWGGDPRS